MQGKFCPDNFVEALTGWYLAHIPVSFESHSNPLFDRFSRDEEWLGQAFLICRPLLSECDKK